MSKQTNKQRQETEHNTSSISPIVWGDGNVEDFSLIADQKATTICIAKVCIISYITTHGGAGGVGHHRASDAPCGGLCLCT